MGVPGFFKELINAYPQIIQTNVTEDIKALYIDANCLFHPQCFKILELYKDLKDYDKLVKKMIKRIIDYIDYLIRFINPSDLVYIAVDGVAPVAKINQQRSRRFGYANNYKHAVYQKYKIPYNDTWSNIVITPGTEFMHKLHLEIKKYYTNKIASNTDKAVTYKMIYDSYHTPGEGEHKILQHIKKYSNNDNKSIIIYGMDADLIFLAMASKMNSIYLLRESAEIKKLDNEITEEFKDNVEQELLFANIDYAKQSINDYIKTHIKKMNDYYTSGTNMYNDNQDNQNKTNNDKNNNKNLYNTNNEFCDDYIFICYFLGNDFLPHLPSVDIKINGMSFVLNSYLKAYESQNQNLIIFDEKTKKIKINDSFLTEFIQILANEEETFFKDLLPDHHVKHQRRRCYEHEPYKKEIWEIENLRNVIIEDPIKLGVDECDQYKFRYYNYYFKASEHMDYTVNRLCENYLEGLLWVAKYYFEECPSWRWQYRYTHAPFLSDISMYIRNNNHKINNIQIPFQQPVNMYTQLVGVIPSVYADILPEPYRYLSRSSKSPIIDMFPTSYHIDMINKTQLYKCIPIIPYLDIERVENIVTSIKLNEQSEKMSKFTKTFMLGVNTINTDDKKNDIKNKL